MKTKVIMLILSIGLLIGSSVTAFAAPVETYGLNSRGKIVFDNNTPDTADDIVFDASDLYKIAAKCQ